jgi:chromosomal replication initiator protein
MNNDSSLLTKTDLEIILKVENENHKKKFGYDISPEYLVDSICKLNKIPVDTIKSKTKVKQVSFVRNVCLYALKKKFGNSMSLVQIGSYLGRSNHSSVIDGIRKIEAEIKKNPGLGNHIEKIIREA